MWTLIPYHHMVDNDARLRKRQTALRKLSRRRREERVDTGELDPELNFVCPFCSEVYSYYSGRHKLQGCDRCLSI